MSDKQKIENPYDLVVDELEITLVNRTNQDRTIDLFALPSGSNPSQNMTYGELFETVYSEVTIPQSDFGSTKSWTINWLDEDGNAQTSTFNAETIGDFIFQINNASQDNFDYRESGSDYIIFKIPIETFVYWDAPYSLELGSASALTKPSSSMIYANPISEALNSIKYYGSGSGSNTDGYFMITDSAPRLAFIQYGNLSPSISIDTSVDYSLAEPSSLCYDSFNQYLVISDSSVSGTNDIVWVDLDSGLTLVNTETISASNADGTNFYWEKYNLAISTFFGLTASTNVAAFDETFTEVFASNPLNVSGNPINFAQMRNSFTVDGNGDLWMVNSKQSPSVDEGGIFKFENGDLTQATEEILFSASGMPSSVFKPAVKYINGRFYLLGYSGGGDTYLDVYSSNGSLLYTNVYSNRQIWDIEYNSKLGNYIVLGDASTNEFYVADMSGRIVQSETSGTSNIRHIKYLEGSTTGYNFVLLSSNTTLDNTVRTIENSTEEKPAGSKDEEYYTKNDFTDVDNNTDAVTYTFSSYDVIKGTGISVTDVKGGIPYREVVQGIRSNTTPYLFKTISVGAATIEQANMPITKINRGVTGYAVKLIDSPYITPVQNQFKIQDYRIDMLPKTISKLDYKVKAGQSASITIKYSKGKLNAVVDALDAYIENNIPLSFPIDELSEAINEEQKKYLRDTLVSMAKRKRIEYELEELELEIDSLFENKEATLKKIKELGRATSEVKKIIDQKRNKSLDVKKYSESNIKRIVAEFMANNDD